MLLPYLIKHGLFILIISHKPIIIKLNWVLPEQRPRPQHTPQRRGSRLRRLSLCQSYRLERKSQKMHKANKNWKVKIHNKIFDTRVLLSLVKGKMLELDQARSGMLLMSQEIIDSLIWNYTKNNTCCIWCHLVKKLLPLSNILVQMPDSINWRVTFYHVKCWNFMSETIFACFKAECDIFILWYS
jgi:hypothetical protein